MVKQIYNKNVIYEMRHVKSFEMIQEAKKETRELDNEQLVLVMKNEFSGPFGLLYKTQHGDENMYKKGDLFMYMGSYNATNWEKYYNFAITRGHGDGDYNASKFKRFAVKDFWKKVDKGHFKQINDIKERDELLNT